MKATKKNLFPLSTFYLLLTTILLSTFYLLLSTNVSAQQVSIAVNPPVTRILAKPGKTVQIIVQVINLGDPTNLSTKVVPILPGKNNGTLEIRPDLETPLSFSLLGSDFALGETFFLRTKQSKTLTLQVQIPQNIEEGDYYYSLLLKTQTPGPEDGTNTSMLTGSVGSNILIGVTTSGLTDIMGKITLFKTIATHRFSILGKNIEFFDSTDPISSILEIANTGKNIITPQGTIVLKGPLGETASFDIVPKDILAYSQNRLTATPSAELETTSSLVLRGFFIGKYSLSTTINFGPGSANIFANTYFWAIPLKFILVLSSVVIIGFFIVKKIKPQ